MSAQGHRESARMDPRDATTGGERHGATDKQSSETRIQRRLPTGYITSTSFSGSTVLSILLDELPGVVSTGEATGPVPSLRRPGSYTCSCGELLENCRFWEAVRRRMQLSGFEFDPLAPGTSIFERREDSIRHRLLNSHTGFQLLNHLRDGMLARTAPWQSEWIESVRRNVAYITAVMEAGKGRIFIDASKDAVRLCRLEAMTDLDIAVIHLVRHPAGFVNSARKNERMSIDSAISWWRRSIEHALTLQRHWTTERWVTVRYEDLCGDPLREVRRIMGMFEYKEQIFLPEVIQTETHHIIGNRTRTSGQMRLKLDESWRGELSDSSIRFIAKRTARHREFLGYE